jgi:uncharacterized membrane protein YcaP (DUF421 family)
MTLPDLGSGLPEIAFRTAIVYLVVIVLLRARGKAGVGQMSILDLVLVLIISNAVQNAMVGQNTTLYGGVVAATTLVVLDWIIRTSTSRSKKAQRLIEGEPALLVRDGHVLKQAMDRQGVSNDDLRAALRAHGLERPADAHLVVLETSGAISVVPASARIRPAAAPPGDGA